MSQPRHLTMSALGAVVAIRAYLAKHPESDAKSAATAIQRNDVDFASYDFRLGMELHELLPPALVFGNYHADLRECLAFLILRHRPWWTQAIPYGRDRVASAIGNSADEGRNEYQSLRAAQLYDNPISDEAVEWWDRLGQMLRKEQDDKNLRQGRVGERLSLKHERERLKSLGITHEPHWTAIEDSGAGYDIRSYDKGDFGPVSRLIEVKTSTKEIPLVIVTRNEWEKALQYGSAYIFHIWKLPEETLIEWTVEQMVAHIPENQGDGDWLQAEIEIS